MLSYAILAFSSILFHSPKDCLTNLREGFVRILKMYAVSAYDLAYSPYFRIQNLLALLLEENVCRSMQSPEYGVENPFLCPLNGFRLYIALHAWRAKLQNNTPWK